MQSCCIKLSHKCSSGLAENPQAVQAPLTQLDCQLVASLSRCSILSDHPRSQPMTRLPPEMLQTTQPQLSMLVSSCQSFW